MGRLFDRYLDSHWRDRCDDPAIWERILAIPDDELWKVQGELRKFLVTFVRERARERWMQERVSAGRVVVGGTLLSPDVLTIGFARRFATYKRAELIFRDPDRLARILNNPRQPMQIIFAGKAHPADDGGKRVLQNVYRFASDPAFGGRVAFVDDYDLHVAHCLVQGCDVWLNTPRKPLEASGTSGMKASMNGAVNVSIGDGWWAEGYTGSNGFLIDPGIETADHDAMDARRRRRALPAARGADRAGLLRARRAGRAAPLGGPGQGRDPHGRAAVLHAPDGEGIRRADVRAGDGTEAAVALCEAALRSGASRAPAARTAWRRPTAGAPRSVVRDRATPGDER